MMDPRSKGNNSDDVHVHDDAIQIPPLLSANEEDQNDAPVTPPMQQQQQSNSSSSSRPEVVVSNPDIDINAYDSGAAAATTAAAAAAATSESRGLRQTNTTKGQFPQVETPPTNAAAKPAMKKGLRNNNHKKKMTTANTQSGVDYSSGTTTTTNPGATTMNALRGLRKNQGPDGSSSSNSNPPVPTSVSLPTLRGLSNNRPPKISKKTPPPPPPQVEPTNILATPQNFIDVSAVNENVLVMTMDTENAELSVPPSPGTGSPPHVRDDDRALVVPDAPTRSTNEEVNQPQEDDTPHRPSLARPPPYTSNTGLAVARAIEDDDSAVLMEAQEVDRDELEKKERDEQKRKECRMVGYALIAICSIILGLSLGLTLGNKNTALPPTPPPPPPMVAPSYTPTESSSPSGALDLLKQALPDDTLERLEVFGSPQYKAWGWLLNYPNISQHEEWKKKQLFALGTFYYSFEGENWNPLIREGWMDYEKEECLWFSSGYGYFNLLDEYVEFPEYRQNPSCNDGGEFVSLYLQDLKIGRFNPSMPQDIALLSSLSTISFIGNNINTSLSDVFPTGLSQQDRRCPTYHQVRGGPPPLDYGWWLVVGF